MQLVMELEQDLKVANVICMVCLSFNIQFTFSSCDLRDAVFFCGSCEICSLTVEFCRMDVGT